MIGTTMRNVTVFEMIRNPQTINLERSKKCEGVFHQWGLDIEEDANGFSSYSIAIIELPDGSVITPRADMVKFTDKEKE